MKEYQKAVKLDQENYKAFSELGYALEKRRGKKSDRGL